MENKGSGWEDFAGIWEELRTAYEAELWGVLDGLKLAKAKGFERIKLCVDSASVVAGLQGSTLGCVRGAQLLCKIKELLRMDWHVDISHVYREANKCADLLASLGCSSDKHWVEPFQPPAVLGSQLFYDAMGVATPRSVTL